MLNGFERTSRMIKALSYLTILFLPLSGQFAFAGEDSEADWHYTVVKNDSFERLYQKYLSKRRHIAELSIYNKYPLAKKLQPGQMLHIPISMLKKSPQTAEVLLATGDVTVSEYANAQFRQLRQHDVLGAGAWVRSSKNSVAKLRFADGSVADVQPNSMLSIQASYLLAGKQTHVTQLKLTQGRTELVANPQHVEGNALQIETPSAVAAVRGTVFRVAAEGNIALQETLDGQVAFNASNIEVLLSKGYGSLAEKGKAPLPPIALPQAPSTQEFSQTFKQLPVVFDLANQSNVVAWVGQLSLDTDFTQIVSEHLVRAQVKTQNQLILSDLKEGQYYLRLRAQDAHGLQGESAVHVFSLDIPSPQPVQKIALSQPKENAVVPLAPVEFSWASIPNVTEYRVQVSRNENFDKLVYDLPTATDYLVVNQSFGSGTFYWRIVAFFEGAVVQTSPYQKFSR